MVNSFSLTLNVRTCLSLLLPLSRELYSRAMAASSLPSGEGGGRGFPYFYCEVTTSTLLFIPQMRVMESPINNL